MQGREDPAICARCAHSGWSCCTLTPGLDDLCFPVSELERQRMVEFGPGRGGMVSSANSKAFLGHMAKLFPKDRTTMGRVFPLGGQHLRLATTKDGRCLFLSSSGCRLPWEARPYYCRLFPFWVSASTVTAFKVPNCVASMLGHNVSGMLELLGMGRAMVRELHGRMRLAWGFIPEEDLETAVLDRPEMEDDA